MGASVSAPGEEDAERLRAGLPEACVEAAKLIQDADVLLLLTGAGFSADSGLAVYADVAKVKAYADRGLEYHDICQPRWLHSEPELFWGFWGQCFNDYRDTAPHKGYEVINHWVEQRFRRSEVAEVLRNRLCDRDLPSAEPSPSSIESEIQSPYVIEDAAGAFFAFTSNVDAHHFDWFRGCEIRECHGNVELYQCAGKSRCCPGIWRIPQEFYFNVDKESMLAPRGLPGFCESSNNVDPINVEADGLEVPRVGRVRGEMRSTTLRHMPGSPAAFLPAPSAAETGFTDNHPVCQRCGGPARPAILMFGDADWLDLDEQDERWQSWTKEVSKLAKEKSFESTSPLRAVLVEIGAGGNVRTVRHTAEAQLEHLLDAGAQAKLVRINPDFPTADDDDLAGHVISLMGGGLQCIEMIDAAMGPFSFGLERISGTS